MYPGISVKYDADIYAEQIYEDAKFNEWIRDEDIIYTLIDMGVWTHNGDDNLRSLEQQIEDKKRLYELADKDDKKAIADEIKNYQDKIIELKALKEKGKSTTKMKNWTRKFEWNKIAKQWSDIW